MHTPEFRRHFIEFVPGDTLMRLRLATKGWNAAADAFIDEGVKSGEIIVHGGKDISSGTDVARKERLELATRVVFLLNITKFDFRIFSDLLTSIGKMAFSYCESLENIDLLHTNLQELGSYAFSGCANLKSMTIPDSLQTLGDNFFYNCPKLSPFQN
ncbi:hypothetical protein TrLO_g7913 [Triparma laevis f. longispina]|uniref:Leucine-rich repeat domain-containing protein n=1 Tax=Triparma laevis f. longispina TaxID=1714387 RepID=A0A9W7FU38_9STRA|nr:hypothetical protein TrLO_g7913 [Triparma laevis f. longispina]